MLMMQECSAAGRISWMTRFLEYYFFTHKTSEISMPLTILREQLITKQLPIH
jgi:hypothetical protein